jgi:hypothetical protein
MFGEGILGCLIVLKPRLVSGSWIRLVDQLASSEVASVF